MSLDDADRVFEWFVNTSTIFLFVFVSRTWTKTHRPVQRQLRQAQLSSETDTSRWTQPKSNGERIEQARRFDSCLGDDLTALRLELC